MVQVIRDILADTDMFVEKVEHADKDVKGDFNQVIAAEHSGNRLCRLLRQ